MRVGHLESVRQVFNDRLLGESWERDHVVASIPAGPGEVIFDVTVLAASKDAGGEVHQTLGQPRIFDKHKHRENNRESETVLGVISRPKKTSTSTKRAQSPHTRVSHTHGDTPSDTPKAQSTELGSGPSTEYAPTTS